MKTKYFVLVCEGGTELEKCGPYDSHKERLEAAIKIADDISQEGNLFWADVDEDCVLYVGSFAADDLKDDHEK